MSYPTGARRRSRGGRAPHPSRRSRSCCGVLTGNLTLTISRRPRTSVARRRPCCCCGCWPRWSWSRPCKAESPAYAVVRRIRVLGRRHRADPGDRDDRQRRTREPTPPGVKVADFLHQVGISAWIGGLAGADDRRACPGGASRSSTRLSSRFSKVAQGLGAADHRLRAAAGLGSSIWPIEGFWSTHYSRVLVVKLALLVLVLLAAMASKRCRSTMRSRVRLPLVDRTRCSPSPPRGRRRKPCWRSQFSGRRACWPCQARELREIFVATQLNTRGVAAESQSAWRSGCRQQEEKQPQ